MVQKPRSTMGRHEMPFVPTESPIIGLCANRSNPIPATAVLNINANDESLLSRDSDCRTAQPTPIPERHTNSTLPKTMPLIIGVAVRKKMRRINTRRIVAGVAHERVRWNRSIRQSPRETVCPNTTKFTVPIFIQRACPKPAVVGLEYTAPKLFCDNRVEYANRLIRHNESFSFCLAASGRLMTDWMPRPYQMLTPESI